MESRLFDLIIASKLQQSVLSLISLQQHEFVKKRSTLTNLLSFLNIALRAAEEGFRTDVVYLDFSKAFDSIDHALLLDKLYNLGVRSMLLSWIGSSQLGSSQ